RPRVAASVRLVGVGSPHGDDRLGWWFVDAMSRDPVPGVEVRAIADPIRLLDDLEEVETLVVVDACRSGRAPGSIVRREWPTADMLQGDASWSHGFGVARILPLAGALGRLPRSVVLFAVEAGSCGTGEDVTPEVARAVTDAMPQLRAMLRERATAGRSDGDDP